MKKIGVVTVYKNTNYGSKLQSFALQQVLGSLGFLAENIDFQVNKAKHNGIIELYRKIIKPSNIIKFLYRSKRYKRDIIFNEFLNEYINESAFSIPQIEKMIEEGQEPYFKYICGSDQIWAPNQFNEYLFLSFVDDRFKKIAYAPSIGLPTIPSDLINNYRNLINGIEYVSLREKDGAELVSKITKREVPVVVDPTLLLTGDKWREYAVTSKEKSPYILCYFLGSNKEHRYWVERLSKKTGYKIIVLPFATRDFSWGDKRIFEAGPKEFLGLVDGAKVVCTDSYHGMLFSLNMNKEFYSFLRFKKGEKLNQNSRVLNLLTKLELKSRIVDTNEKNIFGEINWQDVNCKIDKERAISLEFLEKSLEKSNFKYEDR